ncbi:tigger transposable element-derived protein 4-like [Metopolophium dirhodum]|uniref:tigger transposable element-derived protein 4-like n=1 Tax=Metopolophium dirhodum TaxID=44670 RepID=UPI0029900303|nr:tigger transposable element-derived protein 4-like [Metopolophium dirhodum]
MDGSEKLKPLFIETIKKSWMNTKLWNEWLETLNNDMRKQRRKIIMFVDNCTTHNNPPTLSNVLIEFLPTNTTSKLQPLDQGIIKNFKVLYRKEIVSEFLACLDNNDFPKVTILTAITMSNIAWNNVTGQTIFKQLSTFEEFVAIDDDLAICGVLNDEEILNKADDEEGNDEEECCEDPTGSSKEAKSGLHTVLNYLQKHDIDDNVFRNILNLENTIDRISANLILIDWPFIHVQRSSIEGALLV